MSKTGYQDLFADEHDTPRLHISILYCKSRIAIYRIDIIYYDVILSKCRVELLEPELLIGGKRILRSSRTIEDRCC